MIGELISAVGRCITTVGDSCTDFRTGFDEQVDRTECRPARNQFSTAGEGSAVVGRGRVTPPGAPACDAAPPPHVDRPLSEVLTDAATALHHVTSPMVTETSERKRLECLIAELRDAAAQFEALEM